MARTTIIISDDILDEVRDVAGSTSVSGFVREAVIDRLEKLKLEALAAEMEAGYRAEAEEPSLDPDWQVTETDGW